MDWLHNRKTSLAALGLTLAVSLLLYHFVPGDTGHLSRYGVSIPTVQTFYGAAIVVLALLVPVEPAVRRRLRQSPFQWLIIGAAGIIAFWIFQAVIPVQEKRLFDLPFSLWLILVHIIGLCALAVILAADRPLDAPDRRLSRTAAAVLVISGVIAGVLYAASVGEFLRIDNPDEPWTASLATTYADYGSLTSTYLASVHGNPDVVFPRLYYLAMGVWSRLVGNTDLHTLRWLPLMVGAAAAGVLGLGLWRYQPMSRLEKTAVIVSLLGNTAFLRTTHNLRMDISLGLYAACVVWGVLRFFEAPAGRGKYWAVMLGASLFLGTQGIPPVAVTLGTAVGLMLLVWAARDLKTRWLVVGLYTGTCALALAAYYLFQFLPDIPASLSRYQGFVSHYTGVTSLGTFKLPLPTLQIMLRFSLSLSPIMLGFSLLALVILLWRGSKGERSLVLVISLTLAFVFLFLNVAYGYFVIAAPFAAYAIGRLMRWRVAVLVGTFVFFPALLSPPVHDLWRSIQDRPNSQMFTNDAALLPFIPEQTTLVSDDRLWFTLHSRRKFIGWNGLSAIRREEQLTQTEALLNREVEYVICSTEFQSRCDSTITDGLFTLAKQVVTEQETYFIYQRN